MIIQSTMASKDIRLSFQLENLQSKSIDESSKAVRSTRSHSHAMFYIRPEMIPRPKPKLNCVCPSPLKLNTHYDYDYDSDTCFSSQGSDDDTLLCVDNTDCNSEPLTIVDLRKEVIKNCQLSKATSKEYESILINPLHVKARKKTLFSNTIKDFLKETTLTSNSKRRTMVSRPRFTILDVLERAYESTFDLVQSKSSLV